MEFVIVLILGPLFVAAGWYSLLFCAAASIGAAFYWHRHDARPRRWYLTAAAAVSCFYIAMPLLSAPLRGWGLLWPLGMTLDGGIGTTYTLIFGGLYPAVRIFTAVDRKAEASYVLGRIVAMSGMGVFRLYENANPTPPSAQYRTEISPWSDQGAQKAPQGDVSAVTLLEPQAVAASALPGQIIVVRQSVSLMQRLQTVFLVVKIGATIWVCLFIYSITPAFVTGAAGWTFRRALGVLLPF